MFLVDKYKPKINDEHYFFHEDMINKLKIMSQDSSIPHLIFYGMNGVGKKTLIYLFLEMLYDKSVYDLHEVTYNIKSSGTSETEYSVSQSNYHIVINPTSKNFDRNLIHDVAKEYAKNIQLDVFTLNKTFKVILINDLDNLSYYAQTSLRRTMEKYSKKCRFITWCNKLSKVIKPLVSRCTLIRLPSPSPKALLKYGNYVIDQENLENGEELKKIIKDNIKTYDDDIKKLLWVIESLKYNSPLLTPYEYSINKIVMLIMKKNPGNITQMHTEIYNIMITNIDCTYIISSIMQKLLISNAISEKCKYDIIEVASKYEFTIQFSRRNIMHINAFIINVLHILINDS